MSQSKPQFTIKARQVDMPEHERARRLAQAYDRLLSLAETAEKPADPAKSKGGGECTIRTS